MNDLTNPQMCIQLISGAELWIDAEKAKSLQAQLQTIKQNTFVFFEGRTINTASIAAVLLPLDVEELTRRKNGEWKCKFGEWHQRKELCAHVEGKTQEDIEFYKTNGYYPLRGSR